MTRRVCEPRLLRVLVLLVLPPKCQFPVNTAAAGPVAPAGASPAHACHAANARRSALVKSPSAGSVENLELSVGMSLIWAAVL